MSKVFMFTYGTLQPGFGNFRSGLSVGDETFPGTVHGKIYFMYPGSYPVAKLIEFGDRPARGEPESVVHGTWMTVDTDSEEFQSVTQMEIGAGYRVVTVQCTKTGTVGVAYDYRRDPNPDYLIEDGDWARAYREFNPSDWDDENEEEYLD